MEEILDRLKAIRRHSKLNQTEFAKKLGITQSAYSGIETGRETLTDRNISFICIAFGINENWFRTGEGVMINPKQQPLLVFDSDGTPLEHEESELIAIYKKLTLTNRNIAKKQIDVLLESQNIIVQPTIINPIITQYPPVTDPLPVEPDEKGTHPIHEQDRA